MDFNLNILRPNRDNELTIPEETVIRADCGHGNWFVNTQLQQYTFTCRQGRFHYSQNEYFGTVSSLGCRRIQGNQNKPITVRRTNIACGQNSLIFTIGLNVQNTHNNLNQHFIELLHSCFNERLSSVLYVRSFFWAFEPRPAAGDYRHAIINGWFEDNNPVSSNTVFQTNSVRNLYRGFDRGHLAPYADFGFDLLRKATNLYFNMVPMTPHFNEGRWSSLEATVRDNLRNSNFDATILTAGLNVYTNDVLRNGLIKIPDLVFKVVRANNISTVYFLFVNQPPIEVIQRLLQSNLCNFLLGTDHTIRYRVPVNNFRACFNAYIEFNWPQEF